MVVGRVRAIGVVRADVGAGCCEVEAGLVEVCRVRTWLDASHQIHDNGWTLVLHPNRDLTITYPDGTIRTTDPPNQHAA